MIKKLVINKKKYNKGYFTQILNKMGYYLVFKYLQSLIKSKIENIIKKIKHFLI